MDRDTAEAQVLQTANALFYERGIQAVGMDAIRDAAGVSLKRLYQLFPAKDELVEACLRERDRGVRNTLDRFTANAATPRDRVLAIFDWLDEWFREPDFRGCGFINAFGELGPSSPRVTAAVHDQKVWLHQHIGELVRMANGPDWLADQLFILANGAMVTASILGSAEPARQARTAAEHLLEAADVANTP
ncbi:MAG TPA: TetR/AcrR family transcriptional regulator [Jiangellaceae bacterium]